MFSDRLKKLRSKKDISQAKLSDMLGLTQQAIARWEKDKASPDYETLKKISKIFDVSTDYLLGNSVLAKMEEISENGMPNNNSELNLPQLPQENKRVPIIGTVKCGPGGLAYEYLDGYIWVDDKLTGDIRAFHCKGDSMVGVGIFDGDIAIVRIQENVENGELAVVVINGDEGTLKKVRKHDDVIILESANPVYPARIFSGKEVNTIHIVGKVLETRRKY